MATPVSVQSFSKSNGLRSRFRPVVYDQVTGQYVVLDSPSQLGISGGDGDGLPLGANNTVLIRNAANAPVFVLQETGFNLPLGTSAGTVAAGNHTHELDELLATGITAGDALVANGAGGAAWAALTLSIPSSFNVYLNSTFT